jgi:hypothetical protein
MTTLARNSQRAEDARSIAASPLGAQLYERVERDAAHQSPAVRLGLWAVLVCDAADALAMELRTRESAPKETPTLGADSNAEGGVP